MENGGKMVDGAIIGYGAVGQAVAKAFGIEKYFDLKGSTATLNECAGSQFIFICLPTPTVNGEQDRQAIVDIVKQLSQISKTPIIVIRSTVLPGTADYLSKFGMEIVSNPEFGSEDTMEEDIKRPLMVVVGGRNKQVAKAVYNLYAKQRCPKLLTDPVTAETIKYAFNAWFGVKVTYGNLLYDICQSNGGDYEAIKEMFEKHPWVGRNHWEIWHKGYRGFDGRCLPKDIRAFLTYKDNILLKSVILMNEENLRKKDEE